MLFFEADASGGQIGGVHQRNRVRLTTLPTEQPRQQLLIDLAQSTDAHTFAKLMQHPRPRQMAAQAGKATPGGLFGQLGDQQVERVGWSQQGQQMHTPQLRRAQGTTATAGESVGPVTVNKVIRSIGCEKIEQAVGAGAWH